MNVRIIFANGDAVVWGATELEEMKAGVRPLWLGMYWPDANGDPGRRVMRVEPAGWEVDSFMRETTAGSKVTVKVGYAVPDTPRAWAWWLEGERNGDQAKEQRTYRVWATLHVVCLCFPVETWTAVPTAQPLIDRAF